MFFLSVLSFYLMCLPFWAMRYIFYYFDFLWWIGVIHWLFLQNSISPIPVQLTSINWSRHEPSYGPLDFRWSGWFLFSLGKEWCFWCIDFVLEFETACELIFPLHCRCTTITGLLAACRTLQVLLLLLLILFLHLLDLPYSSSSIFLPLVLWCMQAYHMLDLISCISLLTLNLLNISNIFHCDSYFQLFFHDLFLLISFNY